MRVGRLMETFGMMIETFGERIATFGESGGWVDGWNCGLADGRVG